MSYTPDATNANEPVASRRAGTAAQEFRTLKASVNSRIDAATGRISLLETGSVRVPASETTIGRLPVVSSRAGRVLGFDAAGNPTAIVVGTSTDVSLRDDLANSTDTTRGASLVGWRQPGTGAVARTARGKFLEYISVRDFGAIGDGVADDSTAVNNASIAARDANVALYFPGGVYSVKNLFVYTNSKWFGAGRNSVLRLRNAVGSTDWFIKNFNSGTNVDGSDAAVPGDNNILIRDLAIDGNKANQTVATPLILWRRARYAEITGCRLYNSRGMAFDGCNAIDQVVIANNLFQNNEGIDISIRWVSNRCIIANNVIIGANLPTVDGGEAGAVSSDAMLVNATNHSGSVNFNCAEFIIADNVIKGKVRGLTLTGVFDSIVEGNIFGTQTGSTIVVGPSASWISQGINISKNQITQDAGAAEFGISVLGNKISISENVITSASATCVRVSPGASNDINASGNTLVFTALQDNGHGVNVRGGVNIKVSGNVVRNARHAVSVETPNTDELLSNVLIEGNIAINTNREPVLVQNGGVDRRIAAVSIVGNSFYNWGARAANSHDGIFAEQSGGTFDDVYISSNLFHDVNTNPRDAIRLSGAIRAVIEPNQKVFGINGAIVTGYYTAAPASGTWYRGQRIHNFAPVAGGTEGWMCITSGTPGAWRTFGTIAA